MNTLNKMIESRYKKHSTLLKNIKKYHSDLRSLLNSCNELEYEDRMYRFYHHSFKVYYLQDSTNSFVKILRMISPNKKSDPLDDWFETIIREGTGYTWQSEHNKEWLKYTRPILEAFFHAKYFVEMAVKYGTMEEAPEILPSGWAGLLTLYKIR